MTIHFLKKSLILIGKDFIFKYIFMQFPLRKKGFTIVELMVAVTIIAILGAVSFVSYSSYTQDVRDANRIAQLSSIHNLLIQRGAKASLPKPDDAVDIRVEGEIIWYQWYAGENVLEDIWYNTKGLDPLDQKYFTYYVTKNLKYFQLLAFAEDPENVPWFAEKIESKPTASFFTRSFANEEYIERHPMISGKKLWILVTEENIPLQEIDEVQWSRAIDIDTTTTVFKSYLSDSMYALWTGDVMKNLSKVNKVGWKWCTAYRSNLSCLEIAQVEDNTLPGIPDLWNSTPIPPEWYLNLPSDLIELFDLNGEYVEHWLSNNCDKNNLDVIKIKPSQINDFMAWNLSLPIEGKSTQYRFPGHWDKNKIFQLVEDDNGSNTFILNDPLESRNRWSDHQCVWLVWNWKTIIKTRYRENYVIDANIRWQILYWLNIDGGRTESRSWNTYGLYINQRNITVLNVNAFNSIEWIHLDVSADNSLLQNINTFSNTSHGIYSFDGRNQTYANINSFNNYYSGMKFYTSVEHKIHNANIFNNAYGIDSSWNMALVINNSNIFNNTYWVIVNYTNDVMNNVNIHNNDIWIYLQWWTSHAFNKVKLFDNYRPVIGSRWWQSSRYYWDTYVAWNNLWTSQFYKGQYHSYFSDGNLISSLPNMQNHKIIPNIVGWSSSAQGKQAVSINGTEVLSFWSSVQNQIRPLQATSSSSVTEYWDDNTGRYDYNSSKKVWQW